MTGESPKPKLHPISAKIGDELFAWLKGQVKANGTSQSVEIEKCLQKVRGAFQQLHDAETMASLSRMSCDAQQLDIEEVLDPRSAWYAKHGMKAPTAPKRILANTMQELAKKYPAFGDDE